MHKICAYYAAIMLNALAACYAPIYAGIIGAGLVFITLLLHRINFFFFSMEFSTAFLMHSDKCSRNVAISSPTSFKETL